MVGYEKSGTPFTHSGNVSLTEEVMELNVKTHLFSFIDNSCGALVPNEPFPCSSCSTSDKRLM